MKALWPALLLLTACALNPAPVPVAGPTTDVAAIAGEWWGEYRSIETGRTGSIVFKLTAGRDTAYGDVVMLPAEQAAMHQHDAAAGYRPVQQVLNIRFVEVEGSTVLGTIEPYQSPDCECRLMTTFRGEVTRNRIEGTFVIYHSNQDRAPQKGTWWVSRAVK
jgi:hypothetical protein